MVFPDAAADLLEVMGLPGEANSPLTYVTVRRIDPKTGDTLETAANVVALKRKYAETPVGTGMGGEADATVGSFRLWASYLSGLAAPLGERDRITDAGGVAWDIGRTAVEAFGGFVVCEDCVRVRA